MQLTEMSPLFTLLFVINGYWALESSSTEVPVSSLSGSSSTTRSRKDDGKYIKYAEPQAFKHGGLSGRPNNAFVPYRLAILDDVLLNYDKRAWPTYGLKGRPTSVQVNININSLGSVNAANMEYSMDIYLRQSWVDHRLNLTRYGIKENLTLNGDDISNLIWKPDLFFRNVKKANFHDVTVRNVLIRMSPDGHVLYSMRLTLTLSCHMSFRNYPLDTQTCYVIVGAYAQTTDQTTVHWQGKDPITVDDQVEIPEFDIISITPGHFTRDIDTGSFSFLNATLVFQRQNGYHVVQTYMPTFLIVMISWVSFWLNVDASPARVTLGVTTLLTLTTVASAVRTQLPPVSYVKAIDVWIGACSVMVFGALLEFALVNFLSRSKFKAEDLRRSIGLSLCQGSTPERNGPDPAKSMYDNSAKVVVERPSPTIPVHLKRAKLVDRVSRVTFPFAFIVFNAVYWPYYLNPPSQ